LLSSKPLCFVSDSTSKNSTGISLPLIVLTHEIMRDCSLGMLIFDQASANVLGEQA
jgi:hypothetical protein